MARFFPYFVVLTILLGAYWVVMSGFFPERAVNLEVKDAARKVMASEISQFLTSALERTRKQHRLVENIGFLALGPDWTKLNQTEKTLEGLISRIRPAVNTEATLNADQQGLEEVKQELKALEPLSLSAMSDHKRTRTAVAFWVFFGLSLMAWTAGVLQRASR